MGRYPIDWAIEVLNKAGYPVTADDSLPGLYWVNGRELTANQTVDVAMQVDQGEAVPYFP